MQLMFLILNFFSENFAKDFGFWSSTSPCCCCCYFVNTFGSVVCFEMLRSLVGVTKFLALSRLSTFASRNHNFRNVATKAAGSNARLRDLGKGKNHSSVRNSTQLQQIWIILCNYFHLMLTIARLNVSFKSKTCASGSLTYSKLHW